MSKRPRSLAPLLLALLLVAAVGVVAWLAFLSEPTSASSLAESADPSAPRAVASPREGSSAELANEPDDTGAKAADPRAGATPRTRNLVAERTERDLADVVWVEGRVQFPTGTPLDERVEVIADGKDIPGLGNYRAQVDNDGRFRVAFSKQGKTGALKLEARFLYLDKPLTIKLSSPPADLVLEPILGGCIAGMIVPPKGVGADDVRTIASSAEVKASSWAGQGFPVSRKSKVGDDLRYELGGLSAAQDHDLEYEPKGWVGFSKPDVKVRPGEVLTLDIECAQGARLSGRVVDARAAPVGNVSVEIHSTADSNQFNWRGVENSFSDQNGRFVISGIPAGEYELEASRRGFLDFKLPIGKLEDGDVREGLAIELDEGGWVSGVVKWADGRAASGAYVRAEEVTPEEAGRFNFEFNMDDTQRVGPDGAFRISGLADGLVNVFATAKGGSRLDDEDEESNAKRGASKGVRWRAQALNVEPGAKLELILQPGLGLEGRIVDDRGEPVKEFWVSAMEVLEERRGLPLGFEDAVSTKFETEDGSFLLEGLKPGRWKIGARARGHTSASAPDTDVPLDSEPLVITLQRTSSLSGVVVDPRGERVAKAEIRVDVDQRDLFTMTDVNRSTTANSKGEFKLRSAPSGTIKLSARHAQFARSQPLELNVAPGASLEGLRLTLTAGGRLKGKIHDARLVGDATWRVRISGVEGQGSHSARSDARGEFEIERIAPGEYSVQANRSDGDDEDAGGAVATRSELNAKVTIRDGATTDLLLGAPTGESIVARGRVNLAGSPMGGVYVQASRDDFEVSTRSGADGAYAFVLEGAGEYSFVARLPEGGASLNQSASAASGGEVVVNFDFPGGRIAGRVIDRRGEAVPNARLRAQRVNAEADPIRLGTGAVETSPQGEFAFEGLAAGEYTLSVEDDQNWFRSRARFGRTELTGLVLEDGAALDGLEIVVQPASDVTCEVRGLDGQPVAGATVVAQRVDTTDGLSLGENARTSGAGVAVLSGLAEGEYRLIARKDDDVGVSISRVRVRSGESEQARVTLRRGGRISIQVQSATGEALNAAMHVVDGDGIDWARGSAEWSFDELGPRWTLGPLAPGSYRVSAALSEQGDASANVQLTSGEHESVVLRLSND